MRLAACSLALAVSSGALATEIPEEFLGDWVPQTASCQSELRFSVQPSRVVLKNGATTKAFGDIDICRSCEGGAQYLGEVVLLVPEFNSNKPAPFVARFNTSEKRGVTMLDIQQPEIQRMFPFNNVALKRCK